MSSNVTPLCDVTPGDAIVMRTAVANQGGQISQKPVRKVGSV
jgi:hypothetical protein